MQDQDEPILEGKKIDLKQAASLGAGTFCTVGLVDVLAHLGPTGLFVGGLCAFLAARHGPEVIEQVKELMATAETRVVTEPRGVQPLPQRTGGSSRSFLDRALGRFPVEQDEPPVGEDRPVCYRRSVEADSWQDTIDLASDLCVPLDDLVGKAIFICGIRRHGKTTLGARIAEQLGKCYIPLFIPCLEGDYLSLADVLPRAVIAGHPSADEQYRRYEFMAISDRGQDSAEQAYWFGYDILEYGYQVVLDLASYTGLDRAIAIQVNIIKGMFHWANTHPDDRVPAHVFLDEAQRYLPQQLNDSVIVNSEVRTQLLKVYMDITAIGGKRGLSPVILSQRFAQVNNKIMAQSEVFFLMRQTNDNDLDRCMEYVNKQVCSKAQIAAFKLGQGVYIAADGTQQVVQFAPRESSGKRSRTPTAAAAARYASMPLYRPARHQEEEEQEREDAQEQARPSPSRESPLLERGVTAYRAGATTLVKLAAALDISEWKARSLMAQIQEELKKHE